MSIISAVSFTIKIYTKPWTEKQFPGLTAINNLGATPVDKDEVDIVGVNSTANGADGKFNILNATSRLIRIEIKPNTEDYFKLYEWALTHDAKVNPIPRLDIFHIMILNNQTGKTDRYDGCCFKSLPAITYSVTEGQSVARFTFYYEKADLSGKATAYPMMENLNI